MAHAKGLATTCKKNFGNILSRFLTLIDKPKTHIYISVSLYIYISLPTSGLIFYPLPFLKYTFKKLLLPVTDTYLDKEDLCQTKS